MLLLDLARRPLDLDALLELAGGPVPDDVIEGLQRICASEDDVELTAVGRLALVDRVVCALKTRRALEALPEPPPLQTPPILVVGMPRSGTTLLHHLLADHPDLRSLRAWEVLHPLQIGLRDDRLDKTRDRIRRLHRLAPQLADSHDFHATDPEECLPLLEPTLKTISLWQTFPLYAYAEWLTDSDLAPTYAVHARLLRYLAVGHPDRRLVLKGPAHVLGLSAFLGHFPETQLVWTHRDPARVQASLAVLTERFHAPMCTRTDPDRAARVHHRWMVDTLRRSLDSDGIHLRFSDLIREPVAAASRIVAQLGLPPAPLATRLDPRPAANHPPVHFSPGEQAVVDAYRERYL